LQREVRNSLLSWKCQRGPRKKGFELAKTTGEGGIQEITEGPIKTKKETSSRKGKSRKTGSFQKQGRDEKRRSTGG